MKLRAGIVGLGIIGTVHARIYSELKISVVAVLSSNEKSAIKSSLKLRKLLNINPKPFHIIDDFLSYNLDLISICSPVKFHYNQILSSFKYNIPVFCEKPLIDIPNLNNNELKLQLNNIKNHKNRFLKLNTSNTIFVDSIIRYKKLKFNFNKIKFEFFTNGLNRGKAIGFDLLPHGFSILYHVLKEKKIRDFKFEISEKKFFCHFIYGNTNVEFDFREDINGPKHMLFNFDGDEFIRKQSGLGESYKVTLFHVNLKQTIYCDDPFKCYIKNFIQKINNKQIEDDFNSAYAITKLTYNIVEIINKN